MPPRQQRPPYSSSDGSEHSIAPLLVGMPGVQQRPAYALCGLGGMYTALQVAATAAAAAKAPQNLAASLQYHLLVSGQQVAVEAAPADPAPQLSMQAVSSWAPANCRRHCHRRCCASLLLPPPLPTSVTTSSRPCGGGGGCGPVPSSAPWMKAVRWHGVEPGIQCEIRDRHAVAASGTGTKCLQLPQAAAAICWLNPASGPPRCRAFPRWC